MPVDQSASLVPPPPAAIETLSPSRESGSEEIEFTCRQNIYRLRLSNVGEAATLELIAGFPVGKVRNVADRLNQSLRRNGGRHMHAACSYDSPVISIYGDAIPEDLRLSFWFDDKWELRIDYQKNWRSQANP